MTIAERLAEKICSISIPDLPNSAIERASLAIMDAVGTTLAATATEPVERLIAGTLWGDPKGPALLFGRKRRIPPLDAALVNGTALHVLDFDDFNATIGGHPSGPIVPALFALADSFGASGRDFVLAYLVGFETTARVATSVNFEHYEKGWHPSATLGTFGATAASCRLLGLDVPATANALGMAVSLASGVKANFGTFTKSLHIGHCARNAMMAALLSRQGFTASMNAFEHEQGFLNVFNGAGTFDQERMFEAWWTPPQILDPGVVIKQHPCCASAHAPIDATLALMKANGIAADDVASIEAHCHPRRLAHTDRPNPRSALDAKFSVQYCLARAVCDGQLRLEHFEGDTHADPEVRALMGRIRIVHLTAEEQTAMASDFAVTIDLSTVDGRKFHEMVLRPIGYAADDPLPAAQVHAKFLDCAGRALSESAARELAERLSALDRIDAVADLTALIEDGVTA